MWYDEEYGQCANQFSGQSRGKKGGKTFECGNTKSSRYARRTPYQDITMTELMEGGVWRMLFQQLGVSMPAVHFTPSMDANNWKAAATKNIGLRLQNYPLLCFHEPPVPLFSSRQIASLCIYPSKDCIVARVLSWCDPEPLGVYLFVIVCKTPSKVQISFYSSLPVIFRHAWFRFLVDGIHYYWQYLRDQMKRYDIIVYARIVWGNDIVLVVLIYPFAAHSFQF